MSNNLSKDKSLSEHGTRLPHGRPARRFVADQTREVRRLIMKAKRDAMEMNALTADGDIARPGYRPLFDPRELAEKLTWAEALSSDAGTVLKKSFKRMEESGAYRPVAQAPDPTALEPLARDFPNFSAVTAMLSRRLNLCRIAPEHLLKLPPVLLDGPPGVGKTAYCKRLAGIMGLRFEQIDISAGGVDFAMTGLDSGYATGRPGRIWESLTHDSMSVLWLLDEIDKRSSSTKDSGVNYLLGMLEPVSAKRFIDNSTQLPIDASWICYVATCNDRSLIESPLLSRFEIFEVASPDASQMRAVVDSIHADILVTEDWAKAFEPTIADDIAAALTAYSPREIRRRLFEGYANAATNQRFKLLASDLPEKANAKKSESRRIGFV